MEGTWGWANDTWRVIIAADSRKKILERRDLVMHQNHDCLGQIVGGHGDNTRILHTYEDGSTIRKLQTQDDHDYESDMQGNCIRDHASDRNTYSLRDRDNIPILSFAMDHTATGECGTCRGMGEFLEYDHETGDREYVRCNHCEGTGEYKDKFDGVLRLSSVLRKENDNPRDEEMVKLLRGLSDHHGYKPHQCDSEPLQDIPGATGMFHSFEIDGGRTIGFEEFDDAEQKAKDAEQKVPKGNVYLKVRDHIVEKGMEEDGTLNLEKGIYSQPYGTSQKPEMFTEDPGPSVGHHIFKTQFTPKRFTVDTGLSDFLHRGSTMPDEPETYVRWDAKFPKESITKVHEPTHPTRFWVGLEKGARDNSAVYQPHALSSKAVKWISDDENNLPSGAGGSHDVFEVNVPDEDAHKYTTTIPGGNGTRITINKDQDIPWRHTALYNTANHEDGDPAIPERRVHEACGGAGCENCGNGVEAVVKEPERLWFQPSGHSGSTSWRDAHNLENSHLDSETWGRVAKGGAYLYSRKMKPYYDDQETPLRISVPNDPRYVEKHEDSGRGGEALWRFKEGVTIPREDYTIEGIPEEGLAPRYAYLHIPHHHRDNEKVYTPDGIDVSSLRGIDEARSHFKITTNPNRPVDASLALHHQHNRYSPTQADIFKVDMSKAQDWMMRGSRADPSLGERQLGAEGGHKTKVVRLNPDSNMIPWHAIVGLHSKAEVPPVEEFKSRFGNTHMLLASGWGAVSGVGVKS